MSLHRHAKHVPGCYRCDLSAHETDIVFRLRDIAAWKPEDDDDGMGFDECAEAADEIERLRSWKAEATAVIVAWEDVWHALGQPGELGESKAVAALRTVLNGSDGVQL